MVQFSFSMDEVCECERCTMAKKETDEGIAMMKKLQKENADLELRIEKGRKEMAALMMIASAFFKSPTDPLHLCFKTTTVKGKNIN